MWPAARAVALARQTGALHTQCPHPLHQWVAFLIRQYSHHGTILALPDSRDHAQRRRKLEAKTVRRGGIYV